MCGIAGFVDRGGASDDPAARLSRMVDVISHRGPDDVGYLLCGPDPSAGGLPTPSTEMVRWADVGISLGLGHRRLSILDLSVRGHQPMRWGSSRRWIAFNGEIYNFRELRGRLRGRGVEFLTETDTEVLLAGMALQGSDFLAECRGMFAFAYLDLDGGELCLGRDRAGIKPLYYWASPTRFLFASELKAILADGDVPRRVDSGAVHAYLALQIVDHREESFVSGVRQVPPGHLLRLDLTSGTTRLTPYYDLATQVEARRAQVPDDPKAAVAMVREAFVASVREHLVSDVRVGSCLSGGIDSSAIVCVAQGLLDGGDAESASIGSSMMTFSSCHTDPRFDEQVFIDQVVAACRAEAVKVFSTPEALAERFDTLVWHQDEPFTSPAIYAQYCLMESARQHGIKVLLDGQGGDELFAGYRKFFFVHLRQLVKRGRIARAAAELVGGFLHGDGDLFDLSAARRYLPSQFRRRGRSLESYVSVAQGGDGGGGGLSVGASVSLRQLADVQRYSLPALLRYEDRNSMAFGVEARVPFLDHRLMELGLALPSELKIRSGVLKSVLRRAMEGVVPGAILSRRTKMGFAVPDLEWVRGALAPRVDEALHRPDPLLGELLDVGGLRGEFERLRATGSAAVRPREFFRIACLDAWLKRFGMDDVSAFQ